ncbi:MULTISPECIES: GNAT family N-acetyltransferase [unclassified Nocardioides]|uniref:GNAT family N-acetyltransferase n=1 Tax=unclassified Nocardioides TaxID=2615069 RepID=UPI0006FD8192|nr:MULTISPECIES: GNAT family N-acetyltransferase [unclassified Nocardioides]KRA39030.1 GCN5 family acetyltransferase [Nocardioides sp. Root614]KRA92989.1 GCN5 family acetyltransferase [Nocardioides sp. Root682]
MVDAVLPSGLTVRPLVPGDARAVFEVIAEQERTDVGAVEIEEDDLVSEWQRPSYDLSGSSIGVLDGERIVAYAEYMGEERYDAAVLPSHRGRGIGTWLAGWVQDLARSRGVAMIGMPVPEGSVGDRLLTALGYDVRWTSWVLRLPEGAMVEERPLPPGFQLRKATSADHEQVWTVTEDAFLEWAVRERESFEDFAARVWQRPGFEPWHLQVVTAPDGQVVAVANAWNAPADDHLDTYVSKLAVASSHRHRGLAQALLVAVFAAGRERGATSSSLATDSRTGALSLYEKVGMRPASVWLHRAIALGPGG